MQFRIDEKCKLDLKKTQSKQVIKVREENTDGDCRISVKFPPDIYQKVKRLAEIQYRSLASIVIEASKNYVDAYDKGELTKDENEKAFIKAYVAELMKEYRSE
jgi:metal-responsive CopG/Arc/MetJ family transcriptional regulator